MEERKTDGGGCACSMRRSVEENECSNRGISLPKRDKIYTLTHISAYLDKDRHIQQRLYKHLDAYTMWQRPTCLDQRD